MDEIPGVHIENFSDTAVKAAEASNSAMSDTSLYLDQVAAWLLLVPEKLKGFFVTVKAMPRQDVVMWLLAIVVMFFIVDFLINRKKHVGNVRALWLTPGGIMIGGIWHVFWGGLEVLVKNG